MPTKVGKKYVLWLTERSSSAYKDQFGFVHAAFVVIKQVVVTVSEVKSIHGSCSGGIFEALKAISEDGRIFTCNWDFYPDDSSSPEFNWWDGENNFIDACQAYNSKLTPYVTEDGRAAIPIGRTRCIKHHFAYMPDSAGCFFCNNNCPARF